MGKGIDMLSFPSFKFKEPAIDTTDTLSEEIFFVKVKTEADQIRNETMKLKSQVDQLSQERDELILKMEEEESVASLALHELQSANVSHNILSFSLLVRLIATSDHYNLQ